MKNKSVLWAWVVGGSQALGSTPLQAITWEAGGLFQALSLPPSSLEAIDHLEITEL